VEISKSTLSRCVRAVAVGGLLSAGGILLVATPSFAQSDPSDPSDPSGTTTTTAFDDTTTTTSDFGTTSGGGEDALAQTGGESTMLLLAGLGAGTGALVLRRASRST